MRCGAILGALRLLPPLLFREPAPLKISVVVQFENCRPSAYGTAEKLAEKVVEGIKGVPQALKRQPISNDLAARVKLVPFPKSSEIEFFRKL